MNKRVKNIKFQIACLEEEIKTCNQELEDAHANRFLTCGDCGKKSLIKKLTIIDFQYYESNTGSPNGGYYEHGYYAWECPHCISYRENKLEYDLYWEMYGAFNGKPTKKFSDRY
jgi:predicted RNA-binding Zn-ribbon protein involved in translation (DUF1610 family)